MKLPIESLLDPLTEEQQERLASVLADYLDGIDGGWAPSLDELLAEHADLERPLREYIASLNLLQRAADGVNVRPRRVAPSSEPLERQLGDYRLIREIGRGGMGVVYEARQLSLGRTVALKLLPFAALLDQKQITRFQNEAQAAAGLHHPNIVSVFAVGCERGVHYYSMQFIDGQSLDRVIEELRQDPQNCDTASTAKLSHDACLGEAATSSFGGSFTTIRSMRTRNYVRAAVELIMQAADALQHAHECGVVHRDVKPSNLMVDRHGKLWVTDFGLARCEVGPDLTASGDVLGTLRYMSPGQASGKPQLVDHRTDVYSLGITLFELLTLRPAFEGNERADILRRIQEGNIPSLRNLNPAVPYDLETIVLKATAKSRDDCYASAGDFREDLRRFLAGEPAEARRPTLLDKGAKWVLRHKRAAAASCCAALLTLAGVTMALVLLAAEQARTDRALDRARAHFTEVQRVVDRFGAGVSEKLRDLPGTEPVRGELLRDTLAYYDAILKYAGDEPELRADAAAAALKAGAVHEQLGENQPALDKYRLSRKWLLDLVEVGADGSAHQAELALAENNLGALLSRLGNVEESEKMLRSAIGRQQSLVRAHPTESRHRLDLALSQVNLGLALADIGEHHSALGYCRDAVRELQGGEIQTADVLLRHRLSNALYNLSSLMARDNPAEAERLARQSVQLLRDIDQVKARADLALGLANLGVLISHQGQTDEAVRALREAIEIQEKLSRQAPHVVPHRADLASSRNNLGQILLEAEKLQAARKEFAEAERIFDGLARQFPDDPIHFGGLAGVLNNLGILREREQDLTGAVALFERAIEFQQRACHRAPRVVRYRDFLDRHYVNLCRVLDSLGRTDEAEQIRRRSDVVRKT